MRSDTQTVTIDADPKDVLAFVANPENLPRWAIGFAKSVRRDAGHWLVTTGQVLSGARVYLFAAGAWGDAVAGSGRCRSTSIHCSD